jgi:hypothetical protein
VPAKQNKNIFWFQWNFMFVKIDEAQIPNAMRKKWITMEINAEG